jgi:protocatechuate 3,4-dioxygenase, beta subunit
MSKVGYFVFVISMALFHSGCTASGTATAGDDDTREQANGARSDLYQCEGCEGALEAEPSSLTWQSQMVLRNEPGEPLTIDGTVFAVDGVTPAANVVIYAYQTNAKGLYANGTLQTEASRRHGRIRGWVKTGTKGQYRFQTIKPAPYPNDNIPAHVHFTILEPGRQPYWIDDIVFDGEFGVTPKYRRSMTNKGGTGIVSVQSRPDGNYVVRDIILERHPVKASVQ